LNYGTQDILIESIYQDLLLDVDWKLNCLSLIERGNYLVVRAREFPHSWKHHYTGTDTESLTLREFISKKANTPENTNKVSQIPSWSYDESFALKRA